MNSKKKIVGSLVLCWILLVKNVDLIVMQFFSNFLIDYFSLGFEFKWVGCKDCWLKKKTLRFVLEEVKMQ